VNRENGGLHPPKPKKPKVERLPRHEAMKKLWSNPEYRKLAAERAREAMVRRWTDPEGRKAMLAVTAARRKA